MSSTLEQLDRELRDIFGSRLLSLVEYGVRTRAARQPPGQAAHGRGHQNAHPVHTLAVVESLTSDDLRACSGRVKGWHDAGLATPLVLAGHEFDRSLDVFPLEFGAILADHTIVSGANPFQQLTVDAADLRRAVEVQARSHLLHLREGYLETRGRDDALAVLILQSAAAFAALVMSVARLEGHASHDPGVAARHGEELLGIDGVLTKIVGLVGVRDLPSTEAVRLFPPYLDAVQRLVQYIDTWGAR